MKVIGGKLIPGCKREIGAYIAKIYPGGVVDTLNEVQEGRTTGRLIFIYQGTTTRLPGTTKLTNHKTGRSLQEPITKVVLHFKSFVTRDNRPSLFIVKLVKSQPKNSHFK